MKDESQMDTEWIPVKEAAELLNISRRQVTNRIRQGKLKAKRQGKIWLVHSSLTPEDSEIEEIPETSLKAVSGKLEELQEMVDFLKEQVDKKDKQISSLQEQLSEASHRHDTVVMQMTRLLEYHQQPFWRRLFSRKALPPPVDETIMDMETGEKKETGGK